ncbi:hypothetical protein [Erwinia mallotivora]|uniref:Uncharacterized protein n=1 Tax=Erwinia mallotivora TaxID=69222 RepID=A0A014N8R4_9GAMM|nr:hypothetical protein [Erwinia mallotivora]EXU75748.1 hypothetical protein BG55_10875 [Erwinia mallotivora]
MMQYGCFIVGFMPVFSATMFEPDSTDNTPLSPEHRFLVIALTKTKQFLWGIPEGAVYEKNILLIKLNLQSGFT